MRNFDYNTLPVLTYSLGYAAKALLLKQQLRIVYNTYNICTYNIIRVSRRSSDAPPDSQLVSKVWVLGTPRESRFI